MSFVFISRKEFIDQFLRSNPTVARAEIESGLAHAIDARRRGERCSCGNSLWVAGSGVAGLPTERNPVYGSAHLICCHRVSLPCPAAISIKTARRLAVD